MLLNAGIDIILYSDLDVDTEILKNAVAEGLLKEERLNDACRRVLALKTRVGIVNNDKEKEYPAVSDAELQSHQDCARRIAEKSISVIRNDGTVPHTVKEGAKILNIIQEAHSGSPNFVSIEKNIETELKNKGFDVTTKVNPGMGYATKEAIHNTFGDLDSYDVILININAQPFGNTTLRFDKKFATAVIKLLDVTSTKIIYTSFGDPYKIYEFPFMSNYVATYSATIPSIQAAIKVWFGEIEAKGKIPVSFDGFFQRTV
jgi:beta-N-acetylhexosaminidase